QQELVNSICSQFLQVRLLDDRDAAAADQLEVPQMRARHLFKTHRIRAGQYDASFGQPATGCVRGTSPCGDNSVWILVPIGKKARSNGDQIARPDFHSLHLTADFNVIMGHTIAIRQHFEPLAARDIQQDSPSEYGWASLHAKLPKSHLILSLPCGDISV